jgi:hypothetical protein
VQARIPELVCAIFKFPAGAARSIPASAPAALPAAPSVPGVITGGAASPITVVRPRASARLRANNRAALHDTEDRRTACADACCPVLA